MLKSWAIVMLLFLSTLYAYGIKPASVKNLGAVQDAEGMHFPAFSPDGKWIAFSLHGDIWKVLATGGQAQRLTLHEADDVKPRWSPDGSIIAFSSNRNGNFDVWLVSAEGGQPVQVTFHSAWDSISDWTPDGKWLIFYSYTTGELNLWKVRKEGGNPIQLTFDGGRDAVVSPDGRQVVYSYGSADLFRKGYRGAANWDIYTTALDNSQVPKRMTDFVGNELFPFYSRDGLAIFYLREDDVTLADGKKVPVYNLWQMDVSGDNQKQVTKFETDMGTPTLSPDGKTMIFEKDFRLWQLTDEKVSPLSIQINSDTKSDAEITRVLSEGNEMGVWAPDASQIAFVLNGDIWLMASPGGAAHQLTLGPAKDQWPQFSPDGKFLAYFSNKTGNNDIYILDLKTNEEFALTNHPKDDFFHAWSPDGKFIIFTSERSGNRDIWKVSSRGGMAQQLTDSPESEDDAVFSSDGKWIAFDSGKGGNQEVWIMPADGSFKDAQQLTRQGGLTQVPTFSADSNWLAYETNDEEGIASIWMIPRTGGNSMKVVHQGSLPRWSPDGKMILFESDRTGKKNIYRIEAPVMIKAGERIPFFAQIQVNLQEERRQVFEEAWQAIAQEFYDPKFHGLDWNSVKQKYQALVAKTESELEFSVLMNRMVGELQSSHMGFSEIMRKSKVETGEIGWELEEVEGQGQVLKVKNVLRDSPADKAWIRQGDYIFQIAGQDITPTINIFALLNNQVGKEVKIYVSPSLNPTEGRYVTLVPVDSQQIEGIKYRHWLLDRIQMVRQGCQGKVVYMHLLEMNATNLRRFREVVQETVDKADGMILDIRNNGGGLIHQELLDILTRRPYVMFQARGQGKHVQPALYWDKPVVLLINENAFSDAEVFAYAFKILKRGLVIGVPTAGGVIGTRDITLSDQSNFRIPRVGYYSLEGDNLEGLGVKPDHLVVETPQDRALNRDPQLMKAIEVLMAQLEKKEAPVTTPKPVEVKEPQSQGGTQPPEKKE